MTPEEKRIMQEVIDSVHQQFIKAVAEGRKLDRAKVTEIADGRILTGEQAKRLGLVDQVGNFDDAIDATAKLVGIEGKPDILYPQEEIFDLGTVDSGNRLCGPGDAPGEGFELNYRLGLSMD